MQSDIEAKCRGQMGKLKDACVKTPVSPSSAAYCRFTSDCLSRQKPIGQIQCSLSTVPQYFRWVLLPVGAVRWRPPLYVPPRTSQNSTLKSLRELLLCEAPTSDKPPRSRQKLGSAFDAELCVGYSHILGLPKTASRGVENNFHLLLSPSCWELSRGVCEENKDTVYSTGASSLG